MYNETFLDSIISEISTKLNRIELSKLDTIFTVCFAMAMIPIITGVAINLLRY